MTTPALTLPAATDLDEGATPAELWAELLAAGAEAAHYSSLYASLSTQYGRLLFAGEQLLAGRLTMVEFGRVVEETRKR